MDHENRSDKRRSLIYYLKVTDIENDVLLGHLCDLTVGGMKLIGETAVQKGETFTIKINVPERLHRDENITLEAECRWSQRDLNPRFYASGFLFHNVDDLSVYKIKRVIDELTFVD